MRRFTRDRRQGAAEIRAYLNQSARGRRIGCHKPNVVRVLMFVKPIDHISGDFDKIRPFLNRQREREMYRALVGDPHEHTPKYHVYTSVKHEQQT